MAHLFLYFNTSAGLWLNLQKSYEEEVAEVRTELLKKEIAPYKEKRESRKYAFTH